MSEALVINAILKTYTYKKHRNHVIVKISGNFLYVDSWSQTGGCHGLGGTFTVNQIQDFYINGQSLHKSFPNHFRTPVDAYRFCQRWNIDVFKLLDNPIGVINRRIKTLLRRGKSLILPGLGQPARALPEQPGPGQPARTLPDIGEHITKNIERANQRLCSHAGTGKGEPVVEAINNDNLPTMSTSRNETTNYPPPKIYSESVIRQNIIRLYDKYPHLRPGLYYGPPRVRKVALEAMNQIGIVMTPSELDHYVEKLMPELDNIYDWALLYTPNDVERFLRLVNVSDLDQTFLKTPKGEYKCHPYGYYKMKKLLNSAIEDLPSDIKREQFDEQVFEKTQSDSHLNIGKKNMIARYSLDELYLRFKKRRGPRQAH